MFSMARVSCLQTLSVDPAVPQQALAGASSGAGNSTDGKGAVVHQAEPPADALGATPSVGKESVSEATHHRSSLPWREEMSEAANESKQTTTNKQTSKSGQTGSKHKERRRLACLTCFG
jgi:hypothetical protein